MKPTDKGAFAGVISGMFAYHRQPVTMPVIEVYWRGCQRWTLDEVTHAIDVLTLDPEAGRFPAKIGDMARVLEGTHGDRAAIAWGMLLESMQDVGAYKDVVFDDPAIHAAAQDAGGWVKLCRTPRDELGYVQAAFSKAHKAYTARTDGFDYPRMLVGEGTGELGKWAAIGRAPPGPVFIGDPAKCAQVFAGGGQGHVRITRPEAMALPAVDQVLQLAGRTE